MNGDLAKKKTMDFPAPLIAPPMSGCGHSRGGVCVEGGGGGQAGQKQDRSRTKCGVGFLPLLMINYFKRRKFLKMVTLERVGGPSFLAQANGRPIKPLQQIVLMRLWGTGLSSGVCQPSARHLSCGKQARAVSTLGQNCTS
jgi:hypothetical protein